MYNTRAITYVTVASSQIDRLTGSGNVYIVCRREAETGVASVSVLGFCHYRRLAWLLGLAFPRPLYNGNVAMPVVGS